MEITIAQTWQVDAQDQKSEPWEHSVYIKYKFTYGISYMAAVKEIF